ncbi:OLC1v1025222C1 [Oldenlandia corymbosa var. corymbosa]|uniref:OLC1v1025222C1 n=1 Tax=Oldenlandia corymbosa var. corymbosa TaxID=529605 RepID=A0AAV1C484_OLDCO|nr:OLC1v1025222C1 [Oldenlandia corymbosa var. corymbosa]
MKAAVEQAVEASASRRTENADEDDHHHGGGDRDGDRRANSVKDRKFSWAKLHRVDSLNLEARKLIHADGIRVGQEFPPRGTFALYSLLCRYAKVSLIPNHQPEDREVSNYRLDIPSQHVRRSQMIKEKLEKSNTAKILLLLASLLGTSMVIGDGVLTPSLHAFQVKVKPLII